MRATVPVAARAVGLTVGLALGLTGCSGGEEEDGGATPEEVLAEAKTTLDETSGVRVGLATDALPSGVTGITSAEGVGVHPPAFQGRFDVSVNGLPAEVEVIGVDGVTYAKNSLLMPDWTEVEPETYGAPDPAGLMDPESGLSTLLTATKEVEEGQSVRGGEDNREIFTEYSGTVPASAVEPLIPSASGDFDVTYSITEDGELREAVLTGVFYDGADELTYTLTLADYGTEQDITAP